MEATFAVTRTEVIAGTMAEITESMKDVIVEETMIGARIAGGACRPSVRYFAATRIACPMEDSLRFFRTDDESIANR